MEVDSRCWGTSRVLWKIYVSEGKPGEGHNLRDELLLSLQETGLATLAAQSDLLKPLETRTEGMLLLTACSWGSFNIIAEPASVQPSIEVSLQPKNIFPKKKKPDSFDDEEEYDVWVGI